MLTNRLREIAIPTKLNLQNYLKTQKSGERNKIVCIEDSNGEVYNDEEQIRKRIFSINNKKTMSIVQMIRKNKLMHFLQT
jgi:phosphoenolpyruvate synthase/pyruvate phosphate dikinase